MPAASGFAYALPDLASLPTCPLHIQSFGQSVALAVFTFARRRPPSCKTRSLLLSLFVVPFLSRSAVHTSNRIIREAMTTIPVRQRHNETTTMRRPTKRQNELFSEVWKLFPQSCTDVPAQLPSAMLPRQARGTCKKNCYPNLRNSSFCLLVLI